MTALIRYETRGPVAVVTLDDGKVNALSPRMQAEVGAALDRAQAEGLAVLLGGRPGVFSAGFDLGVLRAGGADAVKMLIGGFRLAERLLAFPHPVVIACSGHALAMGVFLVLAGDYRFAADGAHRLGANEVAIGLTMPRFAVEILRQRLAPAHFNRAVTNAEIYGPAAAVDAGFVDAVVPADELWAAAERKALELAALPRATHAASKLRARANALAAIAAAIELDAAELGG